MKRFKTRVLILLVVLMISGCGWARIRAYSGPELAQEELSLLKIGNSPVEIISIDGQKIKADMFDTVELVPGKHIVVAKPDPTLNMVGSPIFETFVAKKGHVYGIVFHKRKKGFFSTSGNWSFDVIDITAIKDEMKEK